MTVLALDIGLSTGWARSGGQCGVFKPEHGGDHGMALALFSDWLEAMLDETPLLYLAVERGFGGNNASGRLTTAMELTAHALAWSRDVPRTDRSAVEVRKWLLGFSRLPVQPGESKAARVRELDKLVLAAVRARGWAPETEHAADACALLCCVQGVQAREAA